MVSSYNGWTASKDRKAIGVAPFKIAGVDFPGGVKSGDVAVVLGYVAAQVNKRVEKFITPGCWGYNYRQNRNSNNLSCHASGTAIDISAPKHGNGAKGTWTPKQTAEIRKILAEVDHVVRWGEDFNGTVDGMHFEINANAAAVKKVARKITLAQSTVGMPKKPTVPGAPADPRLHQGTQGQRVKDIQNALVKHGYKPDPGEMAKGLFGPGTHRALVAFQTAKRLNPDGITWAATWAALRKPKS